MPPPFPPAIKRWRCGPGLGKKNDRAAGAKVEIVGVEFLLIERREEIADCETSIGQSHFEDRVAIIAAGRHECGEFPVTGDQEHVAFLVGGRTGIALPDSAFFGVGGCIEDRPLGQRSGVVGHQPAVIRVDVARRAPSEEDISSLFLQRGARGSSWSGSKSVAPLVLDAPRADDGGLDLDRPTQFLFAGGDSESMQPLHVAVAFEHTAFEQILPLFGAG